MPSTATIVLNTGQQIIVNFDVSKVFVRNNRYQKDNYVNNSGYDPITLYQGTVMGRVHATNVIVPLTSTASDGSQFPVGVLANEVLIVDGGDSVNAFLCDMGDVVAEKLIFAKPGDGLETVVSSRRLKDHLAAQGIKIVNGTIEMTRNDNQ